MAIESASIKGFHCTLALSLVALLLGVPVRAQQIMTFDEYQAIDHAEPYIYEVQSDSGALLYFGSRHSYDPDDVQMERIDDVWTAFDPEVAFTEGGDFSVESLSRNQAIEQYGEFGMTRRLALRDGVPVRSLDPDRASEITYLQERGWSDEELMLFYTLRLVPQSHDQRVSVNLSEAAPQYLASLEERFDLHGPTTLAAFEEAVRRLLPEISDWKAVASSFFYPGPQNPSLFTNRIATDSNHFRDRHHVDLLTDAVEEGHRVFAIMGSAHAVMQEPALRSALE